MRKLLLLTALFSLHSCYREKHVTTQCTVDLLRSECYCRDYEFSLNHLGPLPGNFEKKIFMYCHKLVGFPDYIETATFWEKVRREIQDQLGDHENN